MGGISSVGGVKSAITEGYVEAFGSNGKWGGICDDSFDDNDATGVCAILGFPLGVSVDTNSIYGTAPSGSIVMEYLNCNGTESSIFSNCSYPGEWIDDCDANNFAAVQCSTGM